MELLLSLPERGLCMLMLSCYRCVPVDHSPQASLSMRFFRQEYWSRLPCPPPGDLPHQGIKPESPALQADSLLLNYRGSLIENYRMFLMTVIVINQGKVYFLNFKKWLSIDNHSFHLIRASASDTLWTWLSLTHLNLVMILWNSPIVILTDRWGNQSPEVRWLAQDHPCGSWYYEDLF